MARIAIGGSRASFAYTITYQTLIPIDNSHSSGTLIDTLPLIQIGGIDTRQTYIFGYARDTRYSTTNTYSTNIIKPIRTYTKTIILIQIIIGDTANTRMYTDICAYLTR